MKLLNSDFWILSISSTLIVTLSTMFYFDYTTKVASASTKIIGTISFKNRVAQRKYQRQVIWEEVEQNTLVYNNDSIRTAELSDAIIHLKDGTEINVDENSLIQLSQSPSAININFEHGAISANRVSIGEESLTKLNIASKDTTISIDKSDVVLEKNIGKEDLNVVVNKGEAQLQVGNQKKVIQKDEKAIVSQDKGEVDIEKSKLILNEPAVNKLLISKLSTQKIKFSWNEVKEKVKVYLEISRDKRFKELIINKQVKTNSKVQYIKAGNYYWRIKSIDKNKKENFSEIRKLIIIKDENLNLISPVFKQKFNFIAKKPFVNFRWQPNKIASSYILEISDTKNFDVIIKKEQTTLTNIATDELNVGKYFWRIKTKTNIPQLKYENKSKIQTFEIKKELQISAPIVITPKNKQVSQISVENKDFSLSWKLNKQVKSYEVVVAKDKNFKNIVYKKRLQNNFLTLKEKLPEGVYYWKVRSEVVTEKFTKYSKKQKFTVIEAEKINLKLPTNKKVINLKEKQENTSIEFKWSKSKKFNKYQIEISQDSNFLTIYQKKTINSNSIKFNKIKPGKYYWRVSLLDNKRNQILKSSIHNLAVNKYVKPEIVEPKSVGVLPVAKDIEDKTGIKDKEEVKEIKKGKLTIISPVKRGKIYINNKYRGRKKVVVDFTKEKTFNIKVTATGYYDFKTKIELDESEEKIINASLEKRKKLSRIKWAQKFKIPIINEPIIHNGSIIFTTKNGIIYKVNKNGKVSWKKTIKNGFSCTPGKYKNSLYLVTLDGKFISVNINNGKNRWSRTVMGPLLYGAKPKIYKKKIFFATSYGFVYCFDLKGKKLWEKNLETGIYCSTETDDKYIYVATDDARLIALNNNNKGDIEWDIKLDSRVVSSSPIINKNILYIGSYNGTLYAIDTKKEKIIWEYKTNKIILAPPVIYKKLVYINTDDGRLIAIDSDKGKKKWQFKTGFEEIFKSEIYKNSLHITSGKEIYVLVPKSGKLKWQFKLPGVANTSATAIGNNIYIGLKDGKLMNLRSDLKIILK